MKGANVCIWKIEKTLDEILPLLNNEYFKYIDCLKDLDISEDEKKFIYKWKNLNKSEDEVLKISINDVDIRYVEANAEVEFNAIPYKEWVVEGTLLPKEIRINRNISMVIFVERMGSTYCIVRGAKSLEARIRNNLMQNNRKDSLWGKINIKDIQEYTLNKNFYYWLLNNKGSTLTIDKKELKINDVKGFKSATGSRGDSSYEGEGSNIDLEVPLKSIVSMDEKLISLYIDILYNNKITYSFFLDYNGRIAICEADCGEFASQNPKRISLDKLILSIYFDIIPFLKQKFNESLNNNWMIKEKKFRKKLCVDIIKDLMSKNSLSLSELEKSLDKA